jgi:hypothetical protein
VIGTLPGACLFSRLCRINPTGPVPVETRLENYFGGGASGMNWVGALIGQVVAKPQIHRHKAGGDCQ